MELFQGLPAEFLFQGRNGGLLMWRRGLAVTQSLGNPNPPAAGSEAPQIWTLCIPLPTGVSSSLQAALGPDAWQWFLPLRFGQSYPPKPRGLYRWWPNRQWFSLFL